jgi:putative ABC transport system substrate-binding protein
MRSIPDLIVVFTADLTRIVLDENAKTPIIFVDVSDPIAAKLVDAMESTGTNLSGIASSIAPARQVELIRQIVPSAKRVGVLYNPKNPGSSATVKQLMEGMAKFGVVIIEASISRTNEVGSAARSLTGKVDAFFSIDDATVSKAYSAWVKVALDAKVPLIASQQEALNTGALAGLVFSGKEVGAQSARMALRILRGAKPGSIAPEYIQKPTLWINTSTAQKQGVRLPEALLKSGPRLVGD